MVPLVGIELTTYRLQGGCSTTELKRRKNEFYYCNYLIRVSDGRDPLFPPVGEAGGSDGFS